MDFEISPHIMQRKRTMEPQEVKASIESSASDSLKQNQSLIISNTEKEFIESPSKKDAIERSSTQLAIAIEQMDLFFNSIIEGSASIADLDDFVNEKQTTLINHYQNWINESEIKTLVSLMNKTSVASESSKIAIRGEEFQRLIGKYDPLSNIKFSEFEYDLISIWQLEIKNSQLNELVERFFECKKVIYFLKYFLNRVKQLEVGIIKFFIQGNDETENQRILEDLEEIRITSAIQVKEKAFSCCGEFDLGTELNALVDIIKQTEQVRAGILELIDNDPSTIPFSIVQLEIIKCMRLKLFFDELTAFKDFYIVAKVNWEQYLPNPKRSSASEAYERQTSFETTQSVLANNTIEPFKSLLKPIIKPPPELNKAYIPPSLFEWALEAAQFIGNLSQSEKLREAVARFSNKEESLSEICFIFRLLTPRIITNYDGSYTGTLQKILTKGVKLQPCFSEHVNQLIKSLHAIRWNASAQATLIRSNVTYEEMEDCLRDLKARGLNGKDYPLAQKLEDKLLRFQAIEEEVIALEQQLDWRSIIDKSHYSEVIEKFFALKQKCRQLGMEKYSTSALIDENIKVLEEAAKISNPLESNTKYRFEPLEKLFNKLSEIFDSPGEKHFFYLIVFEVYSSVKACAAEKETLKEIRVTDMISILTDVITQKMKKAQFPEKIEEIKRYARDISNRIQKLQQSSLEINEGFFEQITLDIQSIGNIQFDLFLIQHNRPGFEELLSKLESSTVNKYELLISWTLMTYVLLQRKSNPLRVLKKLKELFSKVPIEYGTIISQARMYQTLLKIINKGESLMREVKYIRTVFKLRKDLAESKEKTKIIPYIDADYLKGLQTRLRVSKLSFGGTRKMLALAIQFSKEEKETFRTMLRVRQIGGKIPDSEFKKFAKKAYTSVVISSELDNMVRELIAERKEWEEKANTIKTKNMEPDALLRELQEFSSLYDKYPIQSQTCEKIVKALGSFTPLYEEYIQLDNENRDSITQTQIVEFEKKLKDFISEFGTKINAFALVKFKRLVWTLKAEIISSTYLGLLAGNKIKAEEVRRLVYEAKKLATIEGTSVSGHLEDFLNELAERIRIAILDIERVESLQDLEQIRQRFEGNVDLGLIYRNKISELNYKIMKIKLKEEEARDKELRLFAAREANLGIPYQQVPIMTYDEAQMQSQLEDQIKQEIEEEILSVSSDFFRVSDFDSSKSRASEPQMSEHGYLIRSRSRSCGSDDDDDDDDDDGSIRSGMRNLSGDRSQKGKRKTKPRRNKLKKDPYSPKIKQEEERDEDAASFQSNDIVSFHTKPTKARGMATEPPIKKKVKKNEEEDEGARAAPLRQTRLLKNKDSKASSKVNYHEGDFGELFFEG